MVRRGHYSMFSTTRDNLKKSVKLQKANVEFTIKKNLKNNQELIMNAHICLPMP